MDPIAEARRQWEEHGWVDAAPGMAAVTSVMRAQQVFLAKVDERLAPFGLGVIAAVVYAVAVRPQVVAASAVALSPQGANTY